MRKLFQCALIYWQSEFSIQAIEEAIALLNTFGLNQLKKTATNSWEIYAFPEKALLSISL